MLEQAQKARQEKTLNKLFRFADGRIACFKTLINEGKFSYSEVADVPSVQYDRVKFNRMDGKEQKEYEEKNDGIKEGISPLLEKRSRRL